MAADQWRHGTNKQIEMFEDIIQTKAKPTHTSFLSFDFLLAV